MTGAPVLGRARFTLLLLSASLNGCCRFLTSGMEPGGCGGSSSSGPEPLRRPYRVTVRACSEAPEIYVTAGQNDGPPVASEAEFRQDYQPRSRRVSAYVSTPQGAIGGEEGDLGFSDVTFWVREPRLARFSARQVRLWRSGFTSVDLTCRPDGTIR